MTSARRAQMLASLQDKAYRDLVVAEEINTGLSFQIRATREARGWSQQRLAEEAGTTQETISRLENPDYGRYSLTTLRRLASALDIALIVRFAPFSDLLDTMAGLSPADLAVADFAHDYGRAPVDNPVAPEQTVGAHGSHTSLVDYLDAEQARANRSSGSA